MLNLNFFADIAKKHFSIVMQINYFVVRALLKSKLCFNSKIFLALDFEL